MLTRTDAKGQVTQYGYDAYERLTSVAYPGSATPGVTYYYDSYGQSTNTWGRLAAVAFGGGCVANGSANAGYLYTYGYNPAGRVTAQGMQVTLNQSYPSDGDQCSSLTVNQSASYSWDNEGRMVSLLYPGSTNNVTYTYDSMGHQNGLTDSVTGTTASATYGTAGEMDAMCLGGINESFAYNSLWQLTGMSATENVYPFTLLSMQYIYPAGHNNGRISQSIDGVLGQTVNYGYDSLNRLSTAQATNGAWGQSYTYDGFGNLTAKTVTAGPTGDVEFATYWRDMVGQDYADQRYYNSNAGRFYTPDPAGAHVGSLTDPTSWNLYIYGNNDPVNSVDPNGAYPCIAGYGPDGSIDWTDCEDESTPIAAVNPIYYAQEAAAAAAAPVVNQVSFGGGDTGILILSGPDATLGFTDAQTAEIAAGVCAAQPELCVVVGVGAAITIVVGLPQVQTLINAITNAVTQSESPTERKIRCTNQYARDLQRCADAYPPGSARQACYAAARDTYNHCMGFGVQ